MADLLARYIKQRSTWYGILGLSALIAAALHPELSEQFFKFVVGVISAIELVRDESKP